MFNYISPQIALIVTLITFKSPSYGHYIYPPFSVMIGWFIAVVSLVPIPVTMVIQVAKRKGSLRQVNMILFCSLYVAFDNFEKFIVVSFS